MCDFIMGKVTVLRWVGYQGNQWCQFHCLPSFPEGWKLFKAGLPRSGKNNWKMKFFPGQGKVRKFCGWSGKFRKDLESQGKVREFENNWLWQADFRKFI